MITPFHPRAASVEPTDLTGSYRSGGRLRGALAGLLTLALVTSILTSAPAAASAAASTKGFTFTNLSHFSLHLTSVTTDGYLGDVPKNAELPQPGLQVDPGQAVDLEIDDVDGGNNLARLFFDVTDQTGEKQGTLELHIGISIWQSQSSIQSPENLVQGVNEGGGTPTVLDVSNTKVDASTLDVNAQANLASNLCVRDDISCSFVLTRPREATTRPTYLHNALNNTCNDETPTASQVDVQGLATRWEVSATAKTKILDTFTTSITARYGQVDTTTETTSSLVKMTVPAQWWGKTVLNVPVWQYTGTYLIRAADTAWTITNANYYEPREAASGTGTGVDLITYEPSPTERALYPTDSSSC